MEPNHFNKDGRGSPKAHFCKIILKSVQEEMSLKGFLFLALVAILFSGAE